MGPTRARVVRTLAVSIPLVALVAGAHPAAADETVALWSITASGQQATALKDQFHRSVTGGLASAGIKVISPAVLERRLAERPGLLGCETSICLARAAELLGADRLVRASIEIFGSSYVFRFEHFAADGRSLGRTEGRCDVCTIAEANEALSLAAARLGRTRAPAPVRAPAATAAPAPVPQAPVAAAGPGPAQPPPTHALTLHGTGSSEPPRAARLWKWATLGVGLVATVIGIALVSLDGSGSCSDAPQKACPRLYDTAGGGWVLTASGLAAIGGAGVMFWLDRNPSPSGRRDAARVGLALRF
jgi:hypothetical protein